jgi:hypothetical protein
MHIVCFYNPMQGARHGLKISFVWVCSATDLGCVGLVAGLIDLNVRLTVNNVFDLLVSGADVFAHPPKLTCGLVLSL